MVGEDKVKDKNKGVSAEDTKIPVKGKGGAKKGGSPDE
jgi:hypothetical protein